MEVMIDGGNVHSMQAHWVRSRCDEPVTRSAVGSRIGASHLAVDTRVSHTHGQVFYIPGTRFLGPPEAEVDMPA